ncbi:conserved hypothetical protein [Talaromyces stipitatus ATCC 10500]|uniref:RNase H type-1 domain-containing protein n=1 Tax=Talaromyces stipitatus (strain ATCC 10500 / CBS 375.48 / QM 6759 / NRRL 1006) TaxID=441959 RepID=B8M465_TALSN|nr:uncharacterized protein TSTA_040020 [Talaromyces stipitatus ATCC 10500]EED20808.1 conserved hypothetical protein [Talaromyces stipitatus ATCC 10500]
MLGRRTDAYWYPQEPWPGRWESRFAYVQEPWRELPHVVIDEREKAVSVHDNITRKKEHIAIYTDGSGYQGYIGVSMVIPAYGKQRTQCIGTEGTSTVYAGEACGIKFALETVLQIAEQDVRIKKPVIFSDSQAALRTLINPRMVSGQMYIRDCVDLLRKCMVEDIDDAWEKLWDKQKAGKPTKKLVTRPSKRTLQYWMFLRKATSSILIQLCTERIGLAHYLWRINKREHPYCAGGLSGQSVKHIFMECPLYADERALMWTRIKGFRRTTDLQKLLSEKTAAVAIAQFIIDTQVLDQFRVADPEAIGMYESAGTAAQPGLANDKDTDVGTRTNAREDDVRSRSASLSVMTNIDTNTSLGSRDSEPANGDVSRGHKGRICEG